MIELSINKENLEKFIENIRKSDKEELEYFFKEKYKENFINLCLKTTNSYLVSDKNQNPIAIGGFQKLKNQNIAQVWLLCTNELSKNKKALYKYIKNKIKQNREKYSSMFNYIYKSNFSSVNFLKSLGFDFVDVENPDFKLFYFIKGDKN